MLERFRDAWAKLLTPVAKGLLRLGLTPDVVTFGGTIGVIVAALVCFPNGWLWQGAVIVGLLVMTDSIDGQMAKLTGKTSRWGAFLDSSFDRLADGAVFGGIALYLAARAEPIWGVDPILWGGIGVWALVAGQVTSYVKARAESLGFSADGGLAARADRLVLILVATLLAGLGVPYVLQVAVVVLAVASTFTVFQRMITVYQQARLEDDHPASHQEVGEGDEDAEST